MLATTAHFVVAQAGPKLPYYGFYPSPRGAEFKELRHNILGFAVTIPSSWIFGVTGQPPLQVAILYPQSLNTAVISDRYETVEIGCLPLEGITLGDAQARVQQGMSTVHPGVQTLEPPLYGETGGRRTVSWLLSWKSQTGTVIVDRPMLMEFQRQVRTVTIRAAAEVFYLQRTELEAVQLSFVPYDPPFQ